MKKEDYIKELKNYLKENNMTMEHFYYSNAVLMRSGCGFNLPIFEQRNPFIASEDIKQLLYCPDTRIVEYYAYAMVKAVRSFEESETLSRETIQETVDAKLEEQTLSRDAIQEEIEKKLEEPTLSRNDIQEEINKKLEEPTLSKSDIQEAVDEKLEETTLTRGDIQEVVEEKLEKKSSIRVFLTNIGRKIANLLNGFAVIKEEKTGRIHLYYHDAKTHNLEGEHVLPQDRLRVDSGYYVNYQEYVDHMVDDLLEKNVDPEEMELIREDGEIRSFGETLDEAFRILKQKGAIRFGKGLKHTKIDTYKDLVEANITGEEEYAGKPLKRGLYVRKDVLQRVFGKYQVRMPENLETEDKTHFM